MIGEEPIRVIARDRYDALVVDALGCISERTFDGRVDLDRADAGNEPLEMALGTPRTPQVVPRVSKSRSFRESMKNGYIFGEPTSYRFRVRR